MLSLQQQLLLSRRRRRWVFLRCYSHSGPFSPILETGKERRRQQQQQQQPRLRLAAAATCLPNALTSRLLKKNLAPAPPSLAMRIYQKQLPEGATTHSAHTHSLTTGTGRRGEKEGDEQSDADK